MAVHRIKRIVLQTSKDKVIDQARAILFSHPQYKNSKEQGNGYFVTNVKPRWWLLGTAMTIRITGEDSTSVVEVSTKSQPLIMGDVFDYYNHYIHEFLLALQQTPHPFG